MARGNAKRSLTTANGRPAAFHERIKDRINTSMIVRRLADHIDGVSEMSATQIQAARILLDRTVPVLKPVEDQGDGGQDFKDITPQRLLHVIEGQAQRTKSDS